MAHMIRKQIYIQRHQQALLKRLARLRGLSEAEIVRQAIEQAAETQTTKAPPGHPSAFRDFLRFARSRQAVGVSGAPRTWKRDDLYEERLRPYGSQKR